MVRVRAHIVVSGLVQGVYFRDNTRRTAQQHGVNGWVRNLPDGRVEAVLEGERSSVEQVVAWAHHGPPRAEVEDVQVSWQEPTGEFGSFEIRY